MKKKIVITVIVLLALAGAGIGGAYAYKNYQYNNLVADVYPVSNLNWGYYGDEMRSYGTVTNDASQDIYLESAQMVSKVCVEEGQSVSVGDELLEYDVTEASLKLEMKKLEMQEIENDTTITQKAIEELKKMTPIPDQPVTPVTPVEPVEPVTPDPVTPEEPEKPEKTGNAYNYIKRKAEPYTGNGSEENPYRFLCTREAVVYGEYLNYLKKKSYTAVFEVREGNKRKGELISSWTVNGAALAETVDKDSEWSVMERMQVDDEPEEPDVDDEPVIDDEPDVDDEPEGYTAAELQKAIEEKEQELKELDLKKRSAELDLKEMEKAVKDGVVCATIDGIVKTVGDLENLPQDGSPFLSITGSEGLYVSGDISEMLLGTVQEGQMITATSWESGQTFTATIKEISKYPKSGDYYSGEGNPNASYYPFTAYIEDATGLRSGEGVELSMTVAGDNTSGDNVIALQKAYIREENGRSYVYKADENNRLVKQYITTGKTVYGEAVIVKDGLSMDDRIAFPYGKTAKEGVAVTDSDEAY